ncbi:MAG: family 78 glycoside hydrolase catalytic domain [Clostridia bacterium]|nr:family 78 glycoside hydrolase catalytic domain [Clostridia bacterium]
MDTYILAGEDTEVFRPIFTYHGFQYAEVELIGQVEILDIQAEVMYTDLETAGSFHCSDPIVNKIFSNTLWSQRDNFMAVPTDCPQRDERLGWTGYAQIFCQSAMYNMDCRRYFRTYLADIRDAQLGNGVIPCVATLPHVEYYSYTGRCAK